MKRIPQNTAVQTISYILKPNQLLTIIDYPSLYECAEDKNGKVIFDDEAGVLFSYKYAKLNSTKVHGIMSKQTACGDVLILKVVMCTDEY